MIRNHLFLFLLHLRRFCPVFSSRFYWYYCIVLSKNWEIFVFFFYRLIFVLHSHFYFANIIVYVLLVLLLSLFLLLSHMQFILCTYGSSWSLILSFLHCCFLWRDILWLSFVSVVSNFLFRTSLYKGHFNTVSSNTVTFYLKYNISSACDLSTISYLRSFTSYYVLLFYILSLVWHSLQCFTFISCCGVFTPNHIHGVFT